MAGARQMVDGCVEQFGKIDILVNNAGILRDRMLFNMSEAEWDDVIAVNLKGVFACSHFAAKEMRAQWSGRILSVTSRSGLWGRVGQVNYAASKAAIVGFTLTAALELRKYGVTCNALLPRAYTDLTHTVPAALRAKRDSQWAGTAVQLRGTPEQVAPLAVYLCSDQAHNVTGQIVGIGGDKISLWGHHREVREAYNPGGWTLAEIQALFPSSIGAKLEAVEYDD